MKKNNVFLLGLLVIMLATGLVLAGCDDGSGNTGNNGALGSSLEFPNRQVQVMNWNESHTSVSFSNYTGPDRTLMPYFGGGGVITNGKLYYFIDSPSYMDTIVNVIEERFSWYKDISADNQQTKGFLFENFEINDSIGEGSLLRGNASYNVSGNSISMTEEYIFYIYVENDTIISGTGTTRTGNDDYSNSTYTYTYSDFNLSLKSGWNVIKLRGKSKTTFTGSIEDPTSSNETGTATMSLGDSSSCRWVLREWNRNTDYSESVSLTRSLLPGTHENSEYLFKRFYRIFGKIE